MKTKIEITVPIKKFQPGEDTSPYLDWVKKFNSMKEDEKKAMGFGSLDHPTKESGIGNMFPVAQRVFAKTIGSSLVSVSPMAPPAGILAFNDAIFGEPTMYILVWEDTMEVYGATPFKDRLIDYIKPGLKVFDNYYHFPNKGKLVSSLSVRVYNCTQPNGEPKMMVHIGRKVEEVSYRDDGRVFDLHFKKGEFFWTPYKEYTKDELLKIEASKPEPEPIDIGSLITRI